MLLREPSHCAVHHSVTSELGDFFVDVDVVVTVTKYAATILFNVVYALVWQLVLGERYK